MRRLLREAGTGDPGEGKGRKKALEINSATVVNMLRRAELVPPELWEDSASRELTGQRELLA